MTPASFPYSTPTPYPTTNPGLSWKTYQNKEAGFSVSYPANWVKEEPQDNTPDLGRIPLDAAEGSLEIEWTTEPTVADIHCTQGQNSKAVVEIIGKEPVQVSGAVLDGCHSIAKTGWKGHVWTIGKVLSPSKVFLIMVEVKEPLQKNKELIFKVLSTLKLGGQ